MREVDTEKIKTLMYLDTQISNRISQQIDELLRGKDIDIDRLKESIDYVVDDQLSRYKRS